MKCNLNWMESNWTNNSCKGWFESQVVIMLSKQDHYFITAIVFYIFIGIVIIPHKLTILLVVKPLVFESLTWSGFLSIWTCFPSRGKLCPCLVTVSNQLSRMNAWPVAIVMETVETLLPATSLVTLRTEVYTYLFGQLSATSISMMNTFASAHIFTNEIVKGCENGKKKKVWEHARTWRRTADYIFKAVLCSFT